jgi:hypothetical protein
MALAYWRNFTDNRDEILVLFIASDVDFDWMFLLDVLSIDGAAQLEVSNTSSEGTGAVGRGDKVPNWNS